MRRGPEGGAGHRLLGLGLAVGKRCDSVSPDLKDQAQAREECDSQGCEGKGPQEREGGQEPGRCPVTNARGDRDPDQDDGEGPDGGSEGVGPGEEDQGRAASRAVDGGGFS